MILGIDASQANRTMRSGTEWYAYYLIREFAKQLNGQNDVKVILYFRNEPKLDLISELPDNFRIKRLRWPFKYFWAQGRMSLEMLVRPPDILFCPAHTIPLIHPKKTFTTLHDVGFEDYPYLYDKLSLLYHRFSAKLAVREATHVFTISVFSKSRIVKIYNCSPEKITVIYLGLDFSKYARRPKNHCITRLRELGLDYQKYFLYIGRLEPKKNIFNLIKAYERAGEFIKDLPGLVLIGREIDILETKKYLKSRPNLKAKIKILGYVSENDKCKLLSGAFAFLFPTYYEGFGLPILEAQACGVPVITSNTTSNPEIAGDGALFVDPTNPQEIADAMAHLVNNDYIRQKLVKLGTDNVKKFSWQQTAEQTLSCIFS